MVVLLEKRKEKKKKGVGPRWSYRFQREPTIERRSTRSIQKSYKMNFDHTKPTGSRSSPSFEPYREENKNQDVQIVWVTG